MWIKQRISETSWDKIVASAAPAIPLLSTNMKKKSRPIFNTADMIRNIIGVFESPIALNRLVARLLKAVIIRNKKITEI